MTSVWPKATIARTAAKGNIPLSAAESRLWGATTPPKTNRRIVASRMPPIERNNAKRNGPRVARVLACPTSGLSSMSADRRGSLVRKADLADAQIVLCGPGREGLPESGFVHGNDPARLVAHLFHHGLSGHDQIELASSRQSNRKVEILDFQLLGCAMQILELIDKIPCKHPGVARRRLTVVADRDPHASPGVAVVSDLEVDPGEDVFHWAVEHDEPLVPCKLNAAQYIPGIDARQDPSQTIGQRHRPYPILQLLLLDIKGRVGKRLNVAEMVEMGVSNKHGLDVLGRQANFCEDVLRRAPVLYIEQIAEILPIVLVVVADINHGGPILTFNHSVTIGKLDITFVVSPVNHAALIIFGNITVFEDIDRIERHVFLSNCQLVFLSC